MARRRPTRRDRNRIPFPDLDAKDMYTLADSMEKILFPMLPLEHHDRAEALLWQVIGDAWYIGWTDRNKQED